MKHNRWCFTNLQEVSKWSQKEGVNLVVVGPEAYLANGISDELKKRGIPCFGPGKTGARIEADKDWAKSFMDRHEIPTARWKSFTSVDEAKKFVKEYVILVDNRFPQYRARSTFFQLIHCFF